MNHAPGSAAEAAFVDRTLVLGQISGVMACKRGRQTSAKYDFSHGFWMTFIDQADYDRYNSHFDHLGFLKDHWFDEVADYPEPDHEDVA